MTAEYTLQHRIAGDACDAAQGEWFEKFEPCTGHLLARVAAGTGADVDGPCARPARNSTADPGAACPARRGRSC